MALRGGLRGTPVCLQNELLKCVTGKVKVVWTAMGTASTELLGNLNPSRGETPHTQTACDFHAAP